MKNMQLGGHNLFYIGKKRRYILDFQEKRFDLEFTRPEYMELGGEKLEYKSWFDLTFNLFLLLQKSNEKSIGELLKLSTEWTKTKIFSSIEKTNHKKVKDGLYLNLNHTALHSFWLIDWLLDTYNINKKFCRIVIFRPPVSEPIEVKTLIKKEVTLKFSTFLNRNKFISEGNIEIIIRNLEKINDLYVIKYERTSNDVFLFDDKINFSLFKSRLLKKISTMHSKSPILDKMKKYFDYLTEFYMYYGY
jgi:hypothetical protein